MLAIFQKFVQKIKAYWHYLLWLLLSVQIPALADSNPFPSIDTGKGGDIVQAAGSHMETALKYTLIGAGGILIIICLAVIVQRLREDNREKDHGNLIMTFILLALGLTIGFVLIGIGWTAFSAQPS